MERIPHAPPLPCHPERSGERDVSRGVERVLRASVSEHKLFCRVRNGSPFCTRSLCSVAHFFRSLDRDDMGIFLAPSSIYHSTFYTLHFCAGAWAQTLHPARRVRRAAEEERRHSPKRQAPRAGADITSRASRKARGGRGAQAFPEAAGSARGRRHARHNAPSLLSQIYKTP